MDRSVLCFDAVGFLVVWVIPVWSVLGLFAQKIHVYMYNMFLPLATMVYVVQLHIIAHLDLALLGIRAVHSGCRVP